MFNFKSKPLATDNIKDIAVRMRQEMYRKQLSATTAYILAIPLGILGLHKFYMRRPASGFFYLFPAIFFGYMYKILFSPWASVDLNWTFIGAFAIFGFIEMLNIGRLIRDIYTISVRIDHANERIRENIVHKHSNL